MALLEQPAASMHDILRIFADKDFRTRIARSLKNRMVRRLPTTCLNSMPASLSCHVESTVTTMAAASLPRNPPPFWARAN